MFSIKREIRHFHVVVVQKREKKFTSKCCCFAYKTYCFFYVIVLVRIVGS